VYFEHEKNEVTRKVGITAYIDMVQSYGSRIHLAFNGLERLKYFRRHTTKEVQNYF